MSINDPKGRELDRQMGEKKMEKKFDVHNGGQHQICIQNQESNEVKAELFIQTGEWTDDYNKVITKKHLKPVEYQAFQVNEMINQLRGEMNSLIEHEVQCTNQNE